MTEIPRYGQTETPVNMLEPIETDFMAGKPFDASLYGRTETPVNLLEPIEGDFAVPHLVLTLKMSEIAEVDVLAVDVYDLILALSDYEKSIGGKGLRLHDKQFDATTVTLTLIPILIESARGRVDRVAALVVDLARFPGRKASGEYSLSEALDRAISSPAERCGIQLGRRSWVVEVQVAA